MDELPHAPEPARPAAVPATRWEALLYRLMLVWGFLLIAAIIVGIVGFLIHFFALQ
jgi:hypothetical protein